MACTNTKWHGKSDFSFLNCHLHLLDNILGGKSFMNVFSAQKCYFGTLKWFVIGLMGMKKTSAELSCFKYSQANAPSSRAFGMQGFVLSRRTFHYWELFRKPRITVKYQTIQPCVQRRDRGLKEASFHMWQIQKLSYKRHKRHTRQSAYRFYFLN